TRRKIVSFKPKEMPEELKKYARLEEEILFLQLSFDVAYEDFLFHNSIEAYKDKSKCKDIEDVELRLDLHKAEVDINYLRVKQRQILYPESRYDSDAIPDCKQFVTQKFIQKELEAEIRHLKKMLSKKSNK
ncbi:MAG: hypothetical protein RSC33_07595, partial [Vagococcus sp.]